ncbi:MAG: hypothetical protein ACI33P_07190 [Lysinibacillus sp.]
MMEEKSIKKILELQGFPVTGDDIIHTASIQSLVIEAQAALKDFPDLYMEKPITVVDKEVLDND